MSEQKQNFTKNEKLVIRAGLAGALGAAVFAAYPVTHEHDTNPRPTTEHLTTADYETYVKAPGQAIVDRFIADVQKNRYVISQQTGKQNGEALTSLNNKGYQEKLTVTADDNRLTFTNEAAALANIDRQQAHVLAGKIEVTHDAGKTIIDVDVSNSMQERDITFSHPDRLDIDFSNMQTLSTAISDPKTTIERVSASGYLSDPSGYNKAWVANKGSEVVTTFTNKDEGVEAVVINDFSDPTAPDRSKPSVDDIIAWQLEDIQK